MAATPLAQIPEQIPELQQLAARVAAGPQLQGSPRLREFFEYVIDCALRDAPEEATEQHIGVHVFHRHPGYNSGDDSIVRSQARLLRAKLHAYFTAEGAAEPIVIEIPKGQYLPVFRPAAETAEATAASAPAEDKPVAEPPVGHDGAVASLPFAGPAGKTRLSATSWAVFAGVLLVIALLAAFAGYQFRGRRDDPPTPALDAFWKPFYGSNNSLVIFSNPAFTGSPSTGLRLLPSAPFNPEDSPTEGIDETYTGTGEAAAIHTLTMLFGSHGSTFVLKRSRLVTWDDARNSSLIFVGAPSQNSALNDLPGLTQFHIAMTPEGHGYIVNSHPRRGEPTAYPTVSPMQETAIVALLPGFEADTRIAIFSGLTTIGTQEAVDFFCQPETLRMLVQQQGITSGPLKPFEAVLQIRVSKGVAMAASFLVVHPH